MPSQFGQDFFVLEMLDGKHGGFFLDSGAADGIRVSNTYLLESAYGWNGICIEPNDALFGALRRNRCCICVNCCVNDRDGEVDFVEQARMLGGILDEYDPALLRHAKAVFHLPEDDAGRPPMVRKRARTMLLLLREHNAPPVIDYWSLDTERSELAILSSFPFEQYSFRVLTVEHNRLAAREYLRQFLASRGYVRVRTLGVDDGYVPAGNAPRISRAWRSRSWRRSR